jgi:hypothetical protein
MNPTMDYIETNNIADTESSLNVIISISGEGTINWGDGVIESFNNPEGADYTHIYSSFGEYKIKFEGKIKALDLGSQSNSEINNTYLNLLQCPNLISLGFSGVNSINGLEKLSKLISLSFKGITTSVTLPLNSSIEFLLISESNCNLYNFNLQTKLRFIAISNSTINNLVTDINLDFAPSLTSVYLSTSPFTSLIVPSLVTNISISECEFTKDSLDNLATLLNTFGPKVDALLDIIDNPGTSEVDLDTEPWTTLISNGWNVNI